MNTETKIIKLQSEEQLEVPKKLYDFLEKNSYEVMGLLGLSEMENKIYKDISSYVSYTNLMMYYFVVDFWPCAVLDIKFINNEKKTTFRSLMKEKIKQTFDVNDAFNDNLIRYNGAFNTNLISYNVNKHNLDYTFYSSRLNKHINVLNLISMLSVKNIKNNCNLPFFNNLINFLKKVDEVSEWLDLYSGGKINFDDCMFYFIVEMFPLFSKKEKIDFIQKYWQAIDD